MNKTNIRKVRGSWVKVDGRWCIEADGVGEATTLELVGALALVKRRDGRKSWEILGRCVSETDYLYEVETR